MNGNSNDLWNPCSSGSGGGMRLLNVKSGVREYGFNKLNMTRDIGS